MANLCFSVLRYFLDPGKVGALPNKNLPPPKNLSLCCGLPPCRMPPHPPLKWHTHEGARPFESSCVSSKVLKDKGIWYSMKGIEGIMVHNQNKILDERTEKEIYTEYKMPRPEYVKEFERQIDICKQLVNARVYDDWSYIKAKTREEIEEMNTLFEKWDNNRLVSMHYFHTDEYITKKDWNLIAELMGEIPYTPCVMINISPNWKGKYGQDPLLDQIMIDGFREAVELYLNSCNRYTKWKYCLESGSEDNFLHAHIVAEINPKIAASVKTHINKGNHTNELKKKFNTIFKNVKGFEGLLEGKFSVQRIMLNTEELMRDKLSYLLEENKPEGHRNKTDLGLVFGGF